ncbi:transposase [Agrobacterium salinitolerans]|nr:transposase [Agrobacterium salinitolerans]
MTKAGQKKEGETPVVLRCDKLATFMNSRKERDVRAMLRDWRAAASVYSRLQWRCFHQHGRFDPYLDPATQYRKDGGKVRSGILRHIALKHGIDVPASPSVEDGVKAKKRILPTPPGLADPLAPLKASLGAAQVQMVRDQVIGTLKSFISNRQNDFVDIVLGSDIEDSLRRQLFTVNRAAAWFDLERSVRVEDEEVPRSARLLARKIMSHILGQHRKPSMKRIGMVVDQRIAELGEARTATSHDLWLRMTVKSEARGSRRIDIPMRSNDYFSGRKGERKRTFQIIEDSESGRITVGVVTDVGKAFEESQKAYAAEAQGPKALDFGLATLFASDEGDLMGRAFLKKLKSIDATISGIARHVQRSGRKPRDSKRYVAHVTRLRGFISTELRRILNRFVAVRKPTTIFLERLNFQSPELSRRMNRILQNCGRGVLRAKLQALKEEFGVETTEVVSAYTSQTCSCCGYVDRRNRRSQAAFACRWCGRGLHADVNAARNIGSERFRSIGSAKRGVRSNVLDMLVTQHVERNTGERGAPADPRMSNPHFAAWADKARLSRRRRECRGRMKRKWELADVSNHLCNKPWIPKHCCAPNSRNSVAYPDLERALWFSIQAYEGGTRATAPSGSIDLSVDVSDRSTLPLTAATVAISQNGATRSKRNWAATSCSFGMKTKLIFRSSAGRSASTPASAPRTESRSKSISIGRSRRSSIPLPRLDRAAN